MALDSDPFLLCPFPPRGGTPTSKAASFETASQLFRCVLFYKFYITHKIVRSMKMSTMPEADIQQSNNP